MQQRSAGKNRACTSLAVLVPAYNEQYLIEASLRLGGSRRIAAPANASGHRRRRLLDRRHAASDRVSAVPRNLQPDFKKVQLGLASPRLNHGKGAAIRTALAHCSTDLVVIHDADMEYHPQRPAADGRPVPFEDADAVFGSRFMPGGYKRALFFRHALGNKLLTFLATWSAT